MEDAAFRNRDVVSGVEEYVRLVFPDRYLDERGLYWGGAGEVADDYVPSLRGGLQVQWTFTKVCNFSCTHCFNGSSPAWRGFEADPDLIVSAILGMTPYNVCLCGGEPLVWKPLPRVIENLRKGGVPLTSMVTNGYVATPDRIRQLFESGLTHLQISLDAVQDEEFVELRGKRDGLQRAVAAVEEALKYPWLDLAVSFTPTKRNVGNWKRFCQEWASRGIRHIRTQPFMPMGAGRYSRDLAPSDEQYLRFHLDTQDLRDELPGCFVDWGDPLEHIWFYTRTPATPWSFGIQTDGWYELSCYIPVLLGSALEHSIEEFWALGPKELWNAPIMRRFADTLTTLRGMSELEVEIYKESSLHIDVFDPEQRDLFLRTDDIEVLREVSDRNMAQYLARWAA